MNRPIVNLRDGSELHSMYKVKLYFFKRPYVELRNVVPFAS